MPTTPKLFGTDGIRGTANTYPITAEVALRTGRAIARVLKVKKVLIGKDTRLSGTMLESALTAGLLSEGADVLQAGVLPTPAIAHLTQHEHCQAGVMLTASHNPYQDNGIKIFGADGYKLSDALEEGIEALIHEPDLPEPASDQTLGQLNPLPTAADTYLRFAQTALASGQLNGLKIVLDCAHGAAHNIGPELFKSLGAQVTTLGTDPNGTNINAQVGSLHPEKAAALVLSEKAQLGICLDGDADRVIFIDETGTIISGDRVLALSAIALKEQGQLRNDTLVATIMSNLGLTKALHKHGITVETTGVGDRLVIQAMRENGHSFGGENSGHLIFSDHATTGDGLVSALKILSFMQSSGKPLSQLADCMNEFPSELHAIKVSDKPPIDGIPELHNAIQSANAALGDDGRTLVRYSGTEKKIRILVEAQNATDAQTHAQNICQAVQNTIGT